MTFYRLFTLYICIAIGGPFIEKGGVCWDAVSQFNHNVHVYICIAIGGPFIEKGGRGGTQPHFLCLSQVGT